MSVSVSKKEKVQERKREGKIITAKDAHFRNKIPGTSRDIVGEFQVDFGYSGVRVRVTLSLKGGITHQELVAENSQGPQVHVLVVRLALHHLWGEVIQCATHGRTPDKKETRNGNATKE